MSLVDVSELMSDAEFMRTISLRRPSVHLANEGEEIASYGADVDISASVQPATAQEVASLPEGERGSGRVVKVYSSTELKRTDGKTTIADVIIVDGESFRVVGVEPWGVHGYFKVLAAEFIP
jgi:hypothetical protein